MKSLALRKILAGLVGIAMVFSLLIIAPLQEASADDAIALTVTGDGVEKEMQFTMAELRALPQKTYNYSGYNHWPALKVFKDRTGPTLQSILDEAGLKDTATLLKFKPSGGKYVHIDYTREQMLDEQRYYFPEGEVVGDVVNWPPKRGETGKIPIKTIIALDDSKGRLCFGQMAPNEPTGGDCVMIQEMCDNGVIEVSTEVLRQWPAPSVDCPSGTVNAGTRVSLIKPDAVPDNVMMYYTLDGSDPSYGSYIFNISYPSFQAFLNAPIPIKKDTVIKAKTIGFGRLDSELVTFEYQAESNFSDMAGHWASDNIKYLVGKGIVSGMSDTEFKPEEKVTRAQFAKMLTAALDLEPLKGTSLTFQDVASDSWYHDYIAAAANAGLINGYDDITFAPDEKISREEMAVIISRALPAEETVALSTENIEELMQNFKDKGEIVSWAEQGIAVAVSCGIVNGMTEDTFGPQLSASRAEAATIIYRMCQQL